MGSGEFEVIRRSPLDRKVYQIDITQVVNMSGSGIQICIRTNDGVDIKRSADAFDAALEESKFEMIPTNHMVCIEANGERTHRWDRIRIAGENCWNPVRPDEMEVLGPIRAIYRG